jgi:superfamily II DNA or RNA helicase
MESDNLTDEEIAAVESQFSLLQEVSVQTPAQANDAYAHLKPYQVAHVQNLVNALTHRGVGVDLSDTGTGKTWTAIAACKIMNLRPIIITPKSTIPNWYEVAETFSVSPLGVVNYETAKNSKYYENLQAFYADSRVDCPYIDVIREPIPNQLTAAGHQKFRIVDIKWILPPRTLIIFDEAQRGKNGIAQRQIMGSGSATATSQLLVSTAPYIKESNNIFGLFLSATITDKIECFDVICFHLGFYAPYNKKAFTLFTKNLEDPKMEALHSKIVPTYGSRMSIEDVKEQSGNEEFRENDVKAKVYEMEASVANEIEQQHQTIHTAMEALRNKELIGSQNPLTVILRARQKIEILKVPKFVELTQKYLQAGKYIVWFLNFKDTKDLLTQKLLQVPQLLTLNDIDFIDGSNSPEDRERIRKEFQDDSLKVLICQIRAGGVGISLHDIIGNHERVGLISPSWSAIEMQQATGRLYRAGAKTNVKQRIVYCKPPPVSDVSAPQPAPVPQPVSTDNPSVDDLLGMLDAIQPHEADKKAYTVEEKICKNVNGKLRSISLLNDGDLSGYKDLV